LKGSNQALHRTFKSTEDSLLSLVSLARLQNIR
jgi:hypothetical protein